MINQRVEPWWARRAAVAALVLGAAVAVGAFAPPSAAAPTAPDAQADCPALLQHTFRTLQTGEPQSLCQFRGKVLLVVNTASYCGYTKQYEGLEALYRKYRDRGLVVVGFPSNDFSQEPGTNREIAEFCRAKATGQAPKWNFHKYVVDRNGRPVASLGSGVAPDSRELTTLLVRLLDEKPAMAGGKAPS